MPKKVLAWIDGAARGNPGPSGGGILLEDAEGNALKEISEYFGDDLTNNQAEYSALVRALEECKSLGVDIVEVRSDSQLLVRQMNGRYRVRSDNLINLHRKAKNLEDNFEGISYEHVSREDNYKADELANSAIDDKA